MRLTVLLACIIAVDTAAAGEVGFVEDFALAKDRAAVLKQLIPGSEDYYYFHALRYQNTEQFAKVEALLPPWLERHGETARLREIRHRQALLTYEKNSEKTLAYLREALMGLFALGQEPTAEQLSAWLPDRWLLRRTQQPAREAAAG